MPGVYVQCVLCGAPFVGTKWLGECRSVYTIGHEWSKSYLSGVGIKPVIHRALCTVPVDPHARYDHEDYGKITKVELGSVPLFEEDRDFWNPDRQVEEEPWGFFFHAHCWEILRQVLYPREIDIHVFKEICMSCPTSYCGIDWGHDYGGIYNRAHGAVPGFCGRLGRLKDLELRANGRPDYMRAVWRFDPLHIPEIEDLLAASKSISNGQQQEDPELFPEIEAFLKRERRYHLSDPLTTLPPEIRETILLLLPSRDVCNLRVASRAFASLQLSNKFWSSRFRRHFEFSFLFETRRYLENSLSSVAWRRVYDGVKRRSAVRNIRNRRRIWDLMLSLAETLIDIADHPLKGVPSLTFYDEKFPQSNMHWRHASSLIELNSYQRDGACQALHCRTIHFNTAIDEVYISLVTIGGKDYVAGMQFILSGGEVAEIGYILLRKRVYMNLRGVLGSRLKPNLQGLHLAVAERGIQGIAFLSSMGELSKWAGSSKGTPCQLFVSHGPPVSSLQAHFDGCKMISLGIPDKANMCLPLRDTALWFPKIPRENSSLVPGWKRSPSLHYHPLLYLDFGGPGGAYLKNIISISLWNTPERHIPRAIEIEYDKPICGSKLRTFTKRGISKSDPQYGVMDAQRFTFNIDGPGGEHITRIDIGNIYAGVEVFSDFNFYTNRGREAAFPSGAEFPEPFGEEVTEKSMVITGIYIDPSCVGAERERGGVVAEHLNPQAWGYDIASDLNVSPQFSSHVSGPEALEEE